MTDSVMTITDEKKKAWVDCINKKFTDVQFKMNVDTETSSPSKRTSGLYCLAVYFTVVYPGNIILPWMSDKYKIDPNVTHDWKFWCDADPIHDILFGNKQINRFKLVNIYSKLINRKLNEYDEGEFEPHLFRDLNPNQIKTLKSKPNFLKKFVRACIIYETMSLDEKNTNMRGRFKKYFLDPGMINSLLHSEPADIPTLLDSWEKTFKELDDSCTKLLKILCSKDSEVTRSFMCEVIAQVEYDLAENNGHETKTIWQRIQTDKEKTEVADNEHIYFPWIFCNKIKQPSEEYLVDFDVTSDSRTILNASDVELRNMNFSPIVFVFNQNYWSMMIHQNLLSDDKRDHLAKMQMDKTGTSCKIDPKIWKTISESPIAFREYASIISRDSGSTRAKSTDDGDSRKGKGMVELPPVVQPHVRGEKGGGGKSAGASTSAGAGKSGKGAAASKPAGDRKNDGKSKAVKSTRTQDDPPDDPPDDNSGGGASGAADPAGGSASGKRAAASKPPGAADPADDASNVQAGSANRPKYDPSKGDSYDNRNPDKRLRGATEPQDSRYETITMAVLNRLYL